MKKTGGRSEQTTQERAGFAVTGAPTNINLVRTMRNSLSRRIALRRPSGEELEALRLEIAEVERTAPDSRRLDELRIRLGLLERLMSVLTCFDPIDIRFNRYEAGPKPITQAVKLCLIDVSAIGRA